MNARTLLMLALSLMAGATARPAAADPPAITIYSRDLAFVRETRALQLGAGDTARIENVPDRLDFGSLRLVPSTGRVVRLAWRSDVPEGEDVLQRALGRRVRVTLRGERTVEGVLVSADGAWLLVRADDGALHTLARGSVDDVAFAGALAGSPLRPALEAVIEGAPGGRTDATLEYLTGGLSWSAEHTLVRRGESEAEWSSRVVVQNGSGVSWPVTRLQLVAGEPNRATPSPVPLRAMAMAAPMQKLEEQSFSEYHLYTLDRPALLRDRESQSLVMLEPRRIHVATRYLYRGGDPGGVTAQILVPDTRAAGLGVPLPAGRVAVYEPAPAGGELFAGESAIPHTPEGDTLTLDVGRAFDLTATRRVTLDRRISDRERETTVEITVRNAKRAPVTVTIDESVSGDVEVLRSSRPVLRPDAGTLRFELPVPAGARSAVSYTARFRS